jgi:hypothetical protein
VVLLVVVAAAFAAATWHRQSWQLPDRFDPWAPLAIADTPGWLTRFKLSRLTRDPDLCHRVLRQAGWSTQLVPDRVASSGCGFRSAVQIDRMRIMVGAPLTLSCPAAVSLALWERHVLLPTAERVLASAPIRLEHFGSYACRNLYGREGGARSRHATAEAIDIGGIVMKDGRRITIARHWEGTGPEGLFLRELHRGACRFFDATLGPAYNEAHADHFHLDRGPRRACR